MFIPNDNPNLPSTLENVIPESNFNIPQRTSDVYQPSTTPPGNFNPVNNITPPVSGNSVLL